MFQIDAGRMVAAALAALLLCACPGALLAQEAAQPGDPLDLPPLDPSAPLEPLPDLGVDWPDMEQGSDDRIADAPDAGIADSAAERRYSVRIEGLDTDTEAALRSQFDSLSTLAKDARDPANAAQIDRRAREDADLLGELLRARGYYDALVRTRVEAAASGGQVTVTLEAEPGPVYRFAGIDLPGIDSAGEDSAALREAFGLAANEPVDAARVTAGEAALRAELGKRGYAFAEVGEMDIALDHETRTAALTLPVNPNGSRKFGRITVDGRPLFSARHIQRIARWKPGAPYRAALVEDLRRALIATGLVSTVAIKPAAAADKSVDLAVSLERAPMRTVAGQAGFGTGEGIRVEASWQHRNLLPPEGAVTFRGVAGTQEQLIGAVLRRNNFRRRDQVLTAQVAISHIDRAAYDARTSIVSAAIERQTNLIWQKKWTWSAGAELVATDERDVDLKTATTRRRTFFIGALPASLSYDGSNDLLDPTQGYRLALRLSPEASLQSGTFGYARTQIDASVYQPFSPGVTLAGRIRLGTILGATRDRIAPSRRFYAGGGGSVRGYGFQRLGPRDPVFDDPIGGRSLSEFAVEARIRFGNWGIVPFFDGGNISTSSLPKFDNLKFGAGIGVRYHTRFGPIRVDVGTPLNPNKGDSRVAVYVSLGQAF
ncbi:MAG: translocation and assembly module TamA [Sphingomonadales bacterium]|jgi:translocation and assembly module TamA|nr:translocation and assembly module TamA [Sphingomonadales bacterium]